VSKMADSSPEQPIPFSGAVLYDRGAERRADQEIQFRDYVSRRGNLDATIDAALSLNSQANPRLRAWAEFIQQARAIRDPKLRAEAVNAFINTLIVFDSDKGKHWKGPWLQTPQDTLMRGTGVCADIAMLKYETLIRVGFPKEDVKYVSSNIEFRTPEFRDQMLRLQPQTLSPDGAPFAITHGVATVKIGNQNWVLNDEQAPLGANIRGNPANERNAFIANAYLEDDRAAFSANGSSYYGKGQIAMRPVLATDGNGRIDILSHIQVLKLPFEVPFIGIRSIVLDPNSVLPVLGSEREHVAMPATDLSRSINDPIIMNMMSSAFQHNNTMQALASSQIGVTSPNPVKPARLPGLGAAARVRHIRSLIRQPEMASKPAQNPPPLGASARVRPAMLLVP